MRTLHGTRKDYWDALDVLLEGCQIIDFDWCYLYLNDAAARHGRRTRKELLGRTMMAMYPGIENTEMFAKLKQCMEERTSHVMENEFTLPDGEKDWFELRIEPVPEGVFVLSLDVTERKRAEEKVLCTNETLQLIRGINQLILQKDDETELLRQACHQLIKGRNYMLAWIGFINEESYDILPVAQAGFEEGYLSSVKITWDSSEHGQGPTGMAIKTAQPTVMRDIVHDPKYRPWKAQALKRGYRSSIALPLKIESKVIGALNVYSGFPDAFDDAEVNLLVELAGDISLGIEKIRRRREQKKINETLQESEKRYRLLAENAADVIWTTDINMRPTYISPSITQLLGYSTEEAMTKTMEEVFTPASFETAKRAFEEEMTIEEIEPRDMSRSWRMEFELIHKDGSTVPVEVKYSFLRGPDGRPFEILAVVRDVTGSKLAKEKLEQSAGKLRKVLEDTVQAIAATSEMRDPYTAGHQRRATQLACAIAKEMNLSEEQIEGLRVAGTLHDIGKIHVPAEILSKPGELTEFEFGIIKIHPKAGYEILKSIEFPWPVAQIVLQHHERMDGSGYPSNLSGEDILLEARILGIADVVEAMSSHRPYRPALGVGNALEEISHNGSDLFGAEVIDCCIKLFYDKGFKFE